MMLCTIKYTDLLLCKAKQPRRPSYLLWDARGSELPFCFQGRNERVINVSMSMSMSMSIPP